MGVYTEHLSMVLTACIVTSSEAMYLSLGNQHLMQEVASDFMTEADPGHPGGFLEPSGGFKGLIHNG